MKIIDKIKSFCLRNKYSLGGECAKANEINLEWWKASVNIGDTLAEVVYKYMLDYYKLDPQKAIEKTIHLNTVGSIIAIKNYDAVIWGSGLHCTTTISNLMRHRNYVKYDIRAVRGPITEGLLEAAGYKCSHIYGDPAIIMPLIYTPTNIKKEYNVSVVVHYSNLKTAKDLEESGYHIIDVHTNDYKYFIDEICKSKLVISSSLHGIILAETYGVQAVFLRNGIENEEIKFYDWYFSTNRHSVLALDSIDEWKNSVPMQLPDLDSMRRNLIESFPKDLWL